MYSSWVVTPSMVESWFERETHIVMVEMIGPVEGAMVEMIGPVEGMLVKGASRHSDTTSEVASFGTCASGKISSLSLPHQQ